MNDIFNDPVIGWLQKKAKLEPKIKKLVLFGSRARDDAHEKSDYDLAIYTLDNKNPVEWILDVKENINTLCGIDVVFVSKETSQSLLDAIINEGVLIYERN